MTFKKQLQMIKDNWLLVGLVLIILLFFSSGSNFTSMGGFGGTMYDYMEESVYGAPMMASSKGYYGGDEFAPEVEERLKTKSASLTTEVERGGFDSAASKLKNIATASDAFILDENVNKMGAEGFQYKVGWYRIKVETSKYDSVVSQLKELGEVDSFSENIDDITGTYVNLKVDIAAEKERLLRYEEMYDEAVDVEDKIKLSDRIFNQERTIDYLEQRIKDLDNKVSYSTILLTINEEQSGYAGMAVVGASTLIKNFVGSFNALLEFVFGILPWAIAILLIWFVYKKYKK